jgi:hypothetical protein
MGMLIYNSYYIYIYIYKIYYQLTKKDNLDLAKIDPNNFTPNPDFAHSTL